MQRTWVTHFDVAGTVEDSREGELGEGGYRDPVSIYLALFALCPLPFAALSLLLDLNGLFHCSASLLLRAVVVAGKVLVLDLERRLGGGRLELASCCLERSHFLVPCDDWRGHKGCPDGHLVERRERTVRALASPLPNRVHCSSPQQPADPTPRRERAFETSAFALDEGSCDRHDDLPQTSEMTAGVRQIILCMTLPAPIFPNSRLQRRYDQYRVCETVAGPLSLLIRHR